MSTNYWLQCRMSGWKNRQHRMSANTLLRVLILQWFGWKNEIWLLSFCMRGTFFVCIHVTVIHIVDEFDRQSLYMNLNNQTYFVEFWRIKSTRCREYPSSSWSMAKCNAVSSLSCSQNGIEIGINWNRNFKGILVVKKFTIVEFFFIPQHTYYIL